jgi:hypothetical protein
MALTSVCIKFKCGALSVTDFYKVENVQLLRRLTSQAIGGELYHLRCTPAFPSFFLTPSANLR